VTSLSAIGGSAYRGTALRPRIGAKCWKRKVQHQRHKSTRKTLPHVLATDLWFRAATGAGSEEAKDLTQGFFALLLERRDLDVVRKEKGACVLTCSRH